MTTNSNKTSTMASSAVSTFGSLTLIAQDADIPLTQVTARTDGFALITIPYTTTASDAAYVYAQIGIGPLPDVVWFATTGGGLGQFAQYGSKNQPLMDSFPNTLCIPIPSDSTWYFSAANATGNEEQVTVSVYWLPVGSIGLGSTYEIVGVVKDPTVPTPRSPRT